MESTKHHTQLRFYKMIADLSARFVAAEEHAIDVVINDAIEQIGNFFHADRSYIFSFSDNCKIADNTHEWCATGIKPQVNELQNIPLSEYQTWVDEWQNGGVTCITDVQTMPTTCNMRQLLEPQGIQSVVMFPLRNQHGMVGMFGLDAVRQRIEWQEEYLSLLSILAETIANALERKRSALTARLQQTVGNSVVRFINTPRDQLNSAIDVIFTDLRQLFGFTHTEFIAEIQPQHLALPGKQTPPIPPENTGDNANNPMNEQPVWLLDYVNLYYQPRADWQHLRCALIALHHQQKPFGYLVLAHPTRRLFESSEHLSALQLIAAAIAGTLGRYATEQENEFLAFHDPLTGLFNRKLLEIQLAQAAKAAKRHSTNTHMAMIVIDIERFKHINDTFNRKVGDEILQQLAQRVRAAITEITDTPFILARIGADQFALLITDLSNDDNDLSQQLESLVTQLQLICDKHFLVANHSILLALAMGVSSVKSVSGNSELIQQAELAMLQAKENGTGAVRYFDSAMQQHASARGKLYDELKRALQKHEFVVHYQLQVNQQSQFIAAEALVRWHHPERGLVGPSQFIPFAEETHLINKISEQVLRLACEQLTAWQHSSHTQHFELSVNISARHILSDGFIDATLAILRETAAPCHLLKFEITESAMIADAQLIIERMHTLQTYGIRFSLDDFGTGYSSLAHLQVLPISELKLDIGFIRNITSSQKTAAIAAAIIKLANELQLTVVAEGIEKDEQAELLRAMGCHMLQGYLFAKPIPAEQVIQYLLCK